MGAEVEQGSFTDACVSGRTDDDRVLFTGSCLEEREILGLTEINYGTKMYNRV